MRPRHLGSLEPASRALLPRLAARPWSAETYLAGSAALALYLGHRPVRDLDLMTLTNRLQGPERRDILVDLLALDPAVTMETARDGFFYSRLGSGTALRLYYYPYPLIEPLETAQELGVASLVDLGLMKLAAIISRGTRRDFVDLHLLCRELPLELLLERAPEKFGHVRDFPLQGLKALADLSAVAGEPLPPGISAAQWEEVEAWLRDEVTRLGRARLRL